jgi:anti-sigma factor RsiW
MPNCESIAPLVTPYVDEQLAGAEARIVDEHLRACPSCHSRVAAERAVRELIQARKQALKSLCAPDALRARCASAAREICAPSAAARISPPPQSFPVTPRTHRAVLNPSGRLPWFQRAASVRTQVAPLAAAASLVLIVGGAFVYQLTSSSNRVMAAELAADHVKCFALNGLLHTHDDAATVESSMLSGFGWQMRVPDRASTAGLELVGSRPCLYGEGKIAHIMYRDRRTGEPVSLFMLPRTARTEEFVQVLGHQAAIWCARDRTFVLVAHEPKAEVERMVSAVQAGLNR